MKLKKVTARKKSISPNLDAIDDFNDDEICSNGESKLIIYLMLIEIHL
jgi:hypothetical protein